MPMKLPAFLKQPKWRRLLLVGTVVVVVGVLAVVAMTCLGDNKAAKDFEIKDIK